MRWTAAIFLSLGLSSAFGSTEPSSSSQRFDDLFVWMISEKLQLKPATEADFSASFKELSRKKQELSKKVEDRVREIRSASQTEQRRLAIEAYRQSLLELGQVQAQEVERLSKILGDEQFAAYLGLKQDLGKKVRGMVSPKSRKN